MRRSKSPGPSAFCVSDLLFWHDKLPNIWNELVSLVQDVFDGKAIPQEFSYEILCLIPKEDRGKYHGIALLEVVYKLVSMIIHLRLQAVIDFHPLHGFRQRRGTGTCILEAKLHMQLASYLCQPLYQIFVDLTKAYDTLDRSRTLSLHEAYGIGPHIRSIIQAVWDLEMIVPKSGGYFGIPFPAWRGVHQGDIISPIIFNIIGDAVVREWYFRMGDDNTQTFFYTDDGRLAGTDPATIQKGLTLIVELFKCMNLHLNTDKTKAMIMFPHASSRQESREAYTCRFDQSLPTHKERSLQKVNCPQCNRRMNQQFLPIHQHEAHGIPLLCIPIVPTQDTSQLYHVDFPENVKRVPCPVPNCPYSAPTQTLLQRHFSRLHDSDVIIILQEGKLPHCPYCQIFASNVGPKHFATKACRAQAAHFLDRDRLARQAMEATNLVFYIGDVPLENVTEYKYLGCLLSADDTDNATVSLNISKATQTWFHMYRILSSDGNDSMTMACLYLAVVQAKLLYGSETWVLSRHLLDRLKHFHARCACYMAHGHICRLPDGTWEYPPTSEVLDSCGLSTIETYIVKCKTTLLNHYAQSHSALYHRCIMSTPIGSGTHCQMWWN
jgi:hypothetical protein